MPTLYRFAELLVALKSPRVISFLRHYLNSRRSEWFVATCVRLDLHRSLFSIPDPHLDERLAGTLAATLIAFVNEFGCVIGAEMARAIARQFLQEVLSESFSDGLAGNEFEALLDSVSNHVLSNSAWIVAAQLMDIGSDTTQYMEASVN